MLFLNAKNPAALLECDPFVFPQLFIKELDGTMTLSETIQLDKGKVLIFQKELQQTEDSYAFVVCWDKRLDWETFQHIYALYEDRLQKYTQGESSQLEPVFIAKSIDNKVLRFIQEHTETTQEGAPFRTFTF